jgi:hypothetical protein
MRNIWNYKECFDIKSSLSSGDLELSGADHSQFRHKKVSLCVMGANWAQFLTGRILKRAKTASKRVRIKGNYDGLSHTSSRSFSKEDTM